MDMASPHIPYIMSAYGLGFTVFTLLAWWALKEDRKVRQHLAREKSDAP